MRIKFTQDCEDLRPSRNNIIKEGKILVLDKPLGDEYIDKGVAIDLDSPVKEVKKKTKKVKENG